MHRRGVCYGGQGETAQGGRAGGEGAVWARAEGGMPRGARCCEPSLPAHAGGGKRRQGEACGGRVGRVSGLRGRPPACKQATQQGLVHDVCGGRAGVGRAGRAAAADGCGWRTEWPLHRAWWRCCCCKLHAVRAVHAVLLGTPRSLAGSGVPHHGDALEAAHARRGLLRAHRHLRGGEGRVHGTAQQGGEQSGRRAACAVCPPEPLTHPQCVHAAHHPTCASGRVTRHGPAEPATPTCLSAALGQLLGCGLRVHGVVCVRGV